jgi:hypothetical protein
MSEPVETTLEEARRCPKCKDPGVFSHKLPAPRGPGITRGAELHVFKCKNSRCRWFDGVCRIIQINPDGSIPEPSVKRNKDYPSIPDQTAAVNELLARQFAAELAGGAEVTR